MKSNYLSFALLAVISVFTLSCATLQDVAGDFLKNADKPSVSFKNISINELQADRAIMDIELDVENPYAIPLFADSVDFSFLSGETQILSGKTTENFKIPASSIAPMKMQLDLPYKSALETLKTIKPGAIIPLTGNMKFDLTGSDILPTSFDVSKSTDVPIPTPPEVKVESVRWEELSFTNAKANMNLLVLNTNDFPFDLETLDYGLKLGNIDISQANIREAKSLTPGESTSLALDFDLKPSQLGLAAFNMLKSKEIQYEFIGDFDAATPFGPIKWNVAKDGETPLIGN